MHPNDRPLTRRDRLFLAGFLAVVLTGAVVAAGCCTPTPANPRSMPVMDAYERTVRVRTLCLDGRGGGGSGVRIGGSIVLTAAHVVDCGESELVMLTVQTYDGKTYISSLEGTSQGADIARIDGILLPDMPRLAIAKPVLGETICGTFTFPEWGRRCGEVWPSSDDTRVIVDYVSEKGNSGGPVWNADGRLVGLTVVLRFCQGTIVPQVCTAGITSIAPRRWLAAP